MFAKSYAKLQDEMRLRSTKAGYESHVKRAGKR